MTGRSAALADIHGNVWALEAVLDDARRRGVEQFVNLGDVLYGPLQPEETFRRLQSETVLATVAGNEDRIIVAAPNHDLDRNQTVRFVVDALSTEAVDWLRQLPATTVLNGEVLLCHGSPHSSYAILERTADGWDVEFNRVAYDWGEAARCARSQGREDWVQALLTGRVGS